MLSASEQPGHTNGLPQEGSKAAKSASQTKNFTVANAVTASTIASGLAAVFTAQEQSQMRVGSYVRLHGLKNEQYNGQEGMIAPKELQKADVKNRQYSKENSKTHSKKLTWMPTFKEHCGECGRVSSCRTSKYWCAAVCLDFFSPLCLFLRQIV